MWQVLRQIPKLFEALRILKRQGPSAILFTYQSRMLTYHNFRLFEALAVEVRALKNFGFKENLEPLTNLFWKCFSRLVREQDGFRRKLLVPSQNVREKKGDSSDFGEVHRREFVNCLEGGDFG